MPTNSQPSGTKNNPPELGISDRTLGWIAARRSTSLHFLYNYLIRGGYYPESFRVIHSYAAQIAVEASLKIYCFLCHHAF